MPALASFHVCLALSTASIAAVLLLTGPARADDCPPGSIFRSQDGFSFCEPTVCQGDGQCHPNEVCRPVALCMQVGALAVDAATLGDAGKRLVVTQRCAPDKSCPQTTVCSDMGRCLSKTAAEKMGVLTIASAAPAASSGSAPEKKSCGCRAAGAHTEASGALAALTALAVLASRRQRRPSMDRR